MTRHEFGQRFRAALEKAAEYADEQLGYTVPRAFAILLHGAGHGGDLVTPEEAIDLLFVSEERFHAIIDFSVSEVSDRGTTVFVRPSGHRPASWDQTWNTPAGSGPFKQLGPRIPIKVVRG